MVVCRCWLLCESQQFLTQRSGCPRCCWAAWIHAWLSAHYARAGPTAPHWSCSVCAPLRVCAYVCVIPLLLCLGKRYVFQPGTRAQQMHSNLAVKIMKMLWMIWEWVCCCRLYGDAVLCMSAACLYKGFCPALGHGEDRLVETLA